jgi:hypothetical protein
VIPVPYATMRRTLALMYGQVTTRKDLNMDGEEE